MVREWRLRAGSFALMEYVCENVGIDMKSRRLSFELQEELIWDTLVRAAASWFALWGCNHL